jgi:hypothetical protein
MPNIIVVALAPSCYILHKVKQQSKSKSVKSSLAHLPQSKTAPLPIEEWQERQEKTIETPLAGGSMMTQNTRKRSKREC